VSLEDRSFILDEDKRERSPIKKKIDERAFAPVEDAKNINRVFKRIYIWTRFTDQPVVIN